MRATYISKIASDRMLVNIFTMYNNQTITIKNLKMDYDNIKVKRFIYYVCYSNNR